MFGRPKGHRDRQGSQGSSEILELLSSSGKAFGASSDRRSDGGYLSVVNDLIRRAIADRATDIHFEPDEKALKVRCRVDGVLHEHGAFPHEDGKGIISCLKVLASIDIAEKRKAQDGSFRARKGRQEYDLRVASSSSVYGEMVFLRILTTKSSEISIERLGLSEDHLSQLRSFITRSNGMLIITGPTGSGKTTTLYSLLKELDVTQKHVITVEDPVEYHLQGIAQIQVQSKAGVTFKSALESILRQDPDVLMIGEVRDTETAEMAMRASLTGHMVLTTLHTNDAPQAVIRLLNMGMESYLISAAVKCVLSQRLVRVLCRECRSLTPAEPEERKAISCVVQSDRRVWRSSGCLACRHTGYFGRTGIFELMVVDDEMSALISSKPSLQNIVEMARNKNMRSMKEDGVLKALRGCTSVAEIMRVIDT